MCGSVFASYRSFIVKRVCIYECVMNAMCMLMNVYHKSSRLLIKLFL